MSGRVTRSRTTAPLRSFEPFRYLSIDRFGPFFLTFSGLLPLDLQPGPLQVSLIVSPLRAGRGGQ